MCNIIHNFILKFNTEYTNEIKPTDNVIFLLAKMTTESSSSWKHREKKNSKEIKHCKYFLVVLRKIL